MRSRPLVALPLVWLWWCRVAHAAARDVNAQHLAAIERNMDAGADPCEDFYTHACGRWEQQHLLADYQEAVGLVDHQANQQLARALRRLQRLQRRQRAAQQPPFVRSLLNYYEACRRVEEFAPREYLALLQQMEAIEWPSLHDVGGEGSRTRGRHARDTKHTKHDWLRTLALLRKYGLNGVLLESSVVLRKADATTSIVDLDKPVLEGGFRPLSRAQLLLMLDYLGVRQRGKAARWSQALELLELELLRLSEAEAEAEAEADDGNQELTLGELQMPLLQEYLDTLLGHRAPADTVLSVQNLRYMRGLFASLERHEPHTIRGYLAVRFLWHLHTSAPASFLRLECVSHTRGMFPLATSWLQREQHASLAADRRLVGQIFSRLKEHFAATLQANANGLDGAHVAFLQRKLQHMQLRLGNLPRNESVIAHFYADLRLEATSSFYENHLLLLRHFTAAQLARLAQTRPPDDNFFHLEDAQTGASSSPYYLVRRNTVYLPLGLLRRPLYHRQLHPAFQFSALGFLLAHEISHGFDESGIEFDRRGNMRGPAAQIRASERFSRSLGCLRGARPPHFVDERIADVNGLRLAYESYFEDTRLAASASASPSASEGAAWTDGQRQRLFFLNFAQFFCGSTTRAQLAESSEHGRDSERVLRALRNFAAFGRAFQCAAGSPMNPPRKCHLWR